MKVVQLDPLANRRQEVVDMAENILKMAKDGQLIDLAYASALSDGGIMSGYTGTEDAPHRLAAVCRLVHRLQLTMDEQFQ